MKTTKIILIIVILVIILPIIFIFYSISSYENKINQCPYIDTDIFGRDISFEDCFGIISIDKRTLGDVFYVIKDDKHDYNIESVDNTNEYKLSNGNLYIYRVPDNNFQTKLGNDKIYYEKLFMDGEIKTIDYNSVNEIPTYITVDIKTGEVSLYKILDEMPDEDRAIFEELEEK